MFMANSRQQRGDEEREDEQEENQSNYLPTQGSCDDPDTSEEDEDEYLDEANELTDF